MLRESSYNFPMASKVLGESKSCLVPQGQCFSNQENVSLWNTFIDNSMIVGLQKSKSQFSKSSVPRCFLWRWQLPRPLRTVFSTQENVSLWNTLGGLKKFSKYNEDTDNLKVTQKFQLSTTNGPRGCGWRWRWPRHPRRRRAPSPSPWSEPPTPPRGTVPAWPSPFAVPPVRILFGKGFEYKNLSCQGIMVSHSLQTIHLLFLLSSFHRLSLSSELLPLLSLPGHKER